MTIRQIHEDGCPGVGTYSAICLCRTVRESRSDQIPDRPVHWPWLMGPAERPDPHPPTLVEMGNNRSAEWRRERGIA